VNPDFLDVEDVADIHDLMIEEFGGSQGLRDVGLLESAVMQARVSFGGQFLHSDLFRMAAAYLFHIIKNHPFIDGNKRTGLGSALSFLDRNGIPIEGSTKALERLALDVADGDCSKPQAADVLRSLAGR
jgi:death-on-curing protein